MATRLSPYRKVGAATLERRDAVRHIVTLADTSTRDHENEPVEALLHDVSSYGCRIGCATPPAAGARVSLSFAGGRPPVTAIVVWSDQQAAGCRFDTPIEHRLMRALVRGGH